MIAFAKSISDRLLGRGGAALTVPPLDGALKPNNRLEDLTKGIDAATPRALVLYKGTAHWAEGTNLVSTEGVQGSFAADITALAADGARLAVGLAGKGIEISGERPAALASLDCITALAFEGSRLWIAQGSTRHPFANWLHDFMDQKPSGRVLSYDLASGALEVRAEKLGFPYGLLPRADGLIVAESWAKRLIALGAGSAHRILADDLPGYPAGLAASQSGGLWLALFAPRSPLLELVLREPAYRRAMMAEVEPEFWISPALRSGYSFAEPMQGGALKQMGVLKPWAPTRSYGLVVEMDASANPLQSLHSRAGGTRHGVTSLLEVEGTLWIASTGGDEVLCFTQDRGQ